MIIFDDKQANAFYPLTLNRCVGDLRCGILKLRQRLQQFRSGEDAAIWLDPVLQPIYRERHPDWSINEPAKEGTLCVNSRLMVSQESVEAVKNLAKGSYLSNGTDLLAFVCKSELMSQPSIEELKEAGYKELPSELLLYRHLSDIIHANEQMIRFDFEHLFYDNDNYFETEPGVTALNPYNIWIAERVDLKPGVVLDASDGPIILDEGVKVLPNAVIMGPAYIGKKSTIKAGAKIYGGTSIGPVCKVGGEVEGCIFQAYSNKQHDGFLGHAYVGEWVNLGADTNNSDLKNNYKNVKFHSYAQGDKIDSGTMFLGAMIGDHAKLGINSSINTGCVIGLGSNLWGPDLVSDHIPEFSWGQAKDLVPYRIEDFLETAATVKRRRLLDLTGAEKSLYSDIWKRTHG
jgi:UDP-N-acetylglucosamine diphosphorylase/glucosamine-1-phosphate N-acetyltransferase